MDPLEECFALVVDQLLKTDAALAVVLCGQWRRQLDGVEAIKLAEVAAGADSDIAADRLCRSLLDKDSSRRDQRKRVKRAKLVKKKPVLGDKMRDGDASADQVDALNDALDADHDALDDDELVEKVLGCNADQSKKVVKNWLDDRAKESDVADRVEREQRQRKAYRFTHPVTGLEAIGLQGDHLTMKRLWDKICAEERRLWREDGGRDVAISDHARTRDQRMFDAAVAVLANEAKASSSSRPAVVVTIPIEKLTSNPDRAAVEIGNGPIPDWMLHQMIESGDLYAMIADMDHQPLWLGRTRRHASAAQIIALAVRDRGCVVCQADWQKCDAHHLTPFNSPAQGRTDIDTMALNCEGDHHELHNNKRTQYRKPDGTWDSRPARPDEIAPTRPKPRPKRKPDRRSEPHRVPT